MSGCPIEASAKVSKKKIKKILEDNLVRAYLDYAMEAGEKEAQKVCYRAAKKLKEHD